MRILKLLAYGMLGYAFYEIYQGMKDGSRLRSESQPRGFGGASAASPELLRALDEDAGRTANLTGTGRGTTVSTEDADGMSMPHVVGRGVTHR